MTPQDQLRELLKGKSMTVTDLSRKSGVPRTVIHRFLRGEAVGTDKIDTIAQALDCQWYFIQK